MDKDGNFIAVWTDHARLGGGGFIARWFDKWGNLLGREFLAASSPGTSGLPVSARVSASPEGEFLIAQPYLQMPSLEFVIRAQRYTLRPPTVLGVAAGSGGDSIVVGFSHEMATSGEGSVLSTANWALRLADGRYLQEEPRISGLNPLTPAPFGDITFDYSYASQRWEATIPLSIGLPPGEYHLFARSSLQDAAGRNLDGNGDGSPSENFTGSFTIKSPADLNNNGVVDRGDLAILARNYGKSSGATFEEGDLNGDGRVNLYDVAIIQTSLSPATPAASADAAVARVNDRAIGNTDERLQVNQISRRRRQYESNESTRTTAVDLAITQGLKSPCLIARRQRVSGAIGAQQIRHARQ
jgi:hypothetical protein